MQNFYKVTQNNHEKVPSFATRLEGTVNQIWLQCPGRIMDQEVQQHLKYHLFQGVWKHRRDSICYLYSNPGTMYSQLMVAAHKVESKNEEAQDKVWARSAMTTKPVDRVSELGNHIAKLMAALTRAGQGNSPGSTPNCPRYRSHGRGRTDRTTSSHPNSHNGQAGLGQTAPATVYLLVMEQGLQVKVREMPKDPKMVRAVFQTRRTQLTAVFLMSRLGPHGLAVCHPSQIDKPDWGNQGNVTQPPTSSSQQ